MIGTRTPETMYLPPTCLSYDCHEPVSVVIYNRLADQFRSPHEPVAVVYACDKHRRAAAQWCHASDDDITYIGPF
jgi:hypothetical protein